MHVCVRTSFSLFRIFTPISYLLAPEPCLVDLDCMDSIYSFLFEQNQKGFILESFFAICVRANNAVLVEQKNVERKNFGKLIWKFFKPAYNVVPNFSK